MNLGGVVALFLAVEGLSVQRPLVDFDFVIENLKPYGAWEESRPVKYVYRPTVNPGWVPYRNGCWLYTDYGWAWKGADPGSWVTDHYGYWTKRQGNGWVWAPNGNWLPATVEWVKCGDYIGWRPGKLDRFNNPLEQEAERYSDPSEWNFILLEKLHDLLQPGDFVTGSKARDLLVNAQPVDHIFKSYREIERPGPDPGMAKGDGKNTRIIPVVRDLKDLETPPEKAGDGDYYVFRPKFNQDDDGVLRRVELFLHPRKGNEKEEQVKSALGRDPKKTTDADKETEKLEKQLQREREHQDKLYR